jgi:hypothetical protein
MSPKPVQIATGYYQCGFTAIKSGFTLNPSNLGSPSTLQIWVHPQPFKSGFTPNPAPWTLETEN